jgi:hypothetical protein
MNSDNYLIPGIVMKFADRGTQFGYIAIRIQKSESLDDIVTEALSLAVTS